MSFQRQWSNRADIEYYLSPSSEEARTDVIIGIFYKRIWTNDVRGVPERTEKFRAELRRVLSHMLPDSSERSVRIPSIEYKSCSRGVTFQKYFHHTLSFPQTIDMKVHYLN